MMGFLNPHTSMLNLNDRNITKMECLLTLSKYNVKLNPAPVEVSRLFAFPFMGSRMKASRLVYAPSSTNYFRYVLNNVSKIPVNVCPDSLVLIKIMFIVFRLYQVSELNCTEKKGPINLRVNTEH